MRSDTTLANTILAFDTSAAHCAAALLLPDGQCLDRCEDMAKGQAERLVPLLEELLGEAGLVWGDLSGIGVGTGPGNFTGVRISVATARGLALSLGIPAIGVTRLESLAYGLPRPVSILEDARRAQVYHQHFTDQGPGPATLMALDDFVAQSADTPGAVSGSGAGEQALPAAMPLAEAIARIAASRLNSADFRQDPGSHPRPAPFYLRGADAAPPSDPPPVILDA